MYTFSTISHSFSSTRKVHGEAEQKIEKNVGEKLKTSIVCLLFTSVTTAANVDARKLHSFMFAVLASIPGARAEERKN